MVTRAHWMSGFLSANALEGLHFGIEALAVGLAGFAVFLLLRKRNLLGHESETVLQWRLEALERARDTAEQANAELMKALEELERAAGTDRLTGAWNRRRFEEAAVTEMALVIRGDGHVSLLIFDIDHFKRVNDSHGHSVGDQVLVAIAQATQDCLRASDSFVRWGGEEFLVLARRTKLEGALTLAEKIRAKIATIDFPEIGQVTISFGVAEYFGEELSAWVRRADQALYQAKAQGRNQVVASGLPALGDLCAIPILECHWDARFCGGQPVIDAQHQELFALANALMAAITAGQSRSEILLYTKRLFAHVAEHFHDEERLLEQVAYPDLARHASAHARLMKRANEVLETAEAQGLELGSLATFLILDLVKGHMLTEDQKFYPWFQSVTLGASAESSSA